MGISDHQATSSSGLRQVLRFDLDWRFHRGDIDAPIRNTHLAAYMANKAGWARGGAKRNYDDSDWRVVDLPHDWSIELPPDPSEHMDAGYRPRGIGWYRRHFRLEKEDHNRRIFIHFEGVATHCAVFVNGHLLHRNYCGYTPFTVDITDVAEFGDVLNVIALRVDATVMEGWWYEGAGIYRHVWLIKTSPVHISQDGVFVDPRHLGNEVWQTRLQTSLQNHTHQPAACQVTWTIRDDHGESIGTAAAQVTVPPASDITAHGEITVHNPRRWSPDSPVLYHVETTVQQGGQVVDAGHTRFGYRTIRFDPEHGLFLNEAHVLLKGTCNHQDHAGVGVAVPDSVHRLRIRKLKEMGCNAYRTGHHPPARELLDACDELGMLVMNENRNFGSSPEHLHQLQTMIRRDRNHPSVILWSLCNEEPIQTTSVSGRIARAMKQAVLAVDDSRPVTAAVSGGLLNDGCIGDELDVMAINYQLDQHDAYHAHRPHMPVIAAEVGCTYGTRGVVQTDRARQVFASTDQEAAPWGATARDTWRHVRQRPWLAGLFVWTGFDYRGEPTPFEWPSTSSHWGLMDLCGFPKHAYHLHRAWFTAEPFVHLLPHWTYPVPAGERVTVRAYTNCDHVELRLNGESLGMKAVDPVDMVVWDIVYQPGELAALAYREGRAVASARLHTAGPAVKLGLALDPSTTITLPADGEHVAAVTLFATDEAGHLHPTADHAVTLEIDGPADLIGMGNGDPNSHELDQSSTRRLFNGLAQALIRTRTSAGQIRIHAHAEGLASATLEVDSLAAPIRPVVPREPLRHFVTGWRMSPVTRDRPDPALASAAQDMNTWQRVDPSAGPQPMWQGKQGYAIYRATLKLPRCYAEIGARLLFSRLLGQVEAFLGDNPVLLVSGDHREARVIAVPPSNESMPLTLILQAAGGPAGLAGPVEILPPTVSA